MSFIGKVARYVAAFVVFVVVYGAASYVAALAIGVLNYNAGGWVRDYVLPYFIAAISGPIGVAVGFTLIEKLLPKARLRVVTWSFVVLLSMFWLPALIFPFFNGDRFDDGITVMAVGTIAALIAAFRLSEPVRSQAKA